MRTKLRLAWDAVLLWLAGLVAPSYVLLLVLELVRPQPFISWQGATPEWSPAASVVAIESRPDWDTRGWMAEAETELHGALNRVESQLRADLDAMLASVYAWRDEQ